MWAPFHAPTITSSSDVGWWIKRHVIKGKKRLGPVTVCVCVWLCLWVCLRPDVSGREGNPKKSTGKLCECVCVKGRSFILNAQYIHLVNLKDAVSLCVCTCVCFPPQRCYMWVNERCLKPVHSLMNSVCLYDLKCIYLYTRQHMHVFFLGVCGTCTSSQHLSKSMWHFCSVLTLADGASYYKGCISILPSPTRVWCYSIHFEYVYPCASRVQVMP